MGPIDAKRRGDGEYCGRRNALHAAAQIDARRVLSGRHRDAAPTGKTGRKAVIAMIGGSRLLLAAWYRHAQRCRAEGLALGHRTADRQQHRLEDHPIGGRQGDKGRRFARHTHHGEFRASCHRLEPA